MATFDARVPYITFDMVEDAYAALTDAFKCNVSVANGPDDLDGYPTLRITLDTETPPSALGVCEALTQACGVAATLVGSPEHGPT
jgi:hypothetical protein